MTQAVSDLEAHLGFWLRAVSNAVSQEFARRLEGEEVTVAEWVFLRSLYAQPMVSPTDLAARMGMTKGAISKLAERLIDKGLVQRQPDPADGRAHRLDLTATGLAKVPILASIADANDAAFFDPLTQAERDQLRQMMMRIIESRGLTGMPVD